MVARLQLAALENSAGTSLSSVSMHCPLVLWIASYSRLSCFRRRAVHIYLDEACNLRTTLSSLLDEGEDLSREEGDGQIGWVDLLRPWNPGSPPSQFGLPDGLPPSPLLFAGLDVCYLMLSGKTSLRNHSQSYL